MSPSLGWSRSQIIEVAPLLMSRRAPPSWRETLRIALWPRRSWARSLRYGLLRVARVKTMPRTFALGAAAGVFVAVLPIPGAQVISAVGLAWLVRGHRGAAVLSTFAANPVTYPLIWIASYAVGATILGTPVSDATHDLDRITDLMAHPWTQGDAAGATLAGGIKAILPALATLAVGAVPLAAVSATVAYVGVRHLLRRRTGGQKASGGLALVPHAQPTVEGWVKPLRDPADTTRASVGSRFA